jgi:DNA primase (bacterial type)
MTAEQANNISIKHFLSQINIFPMKEKDYYGMYQSPFHPDTEPSFKVDYRQNLWYDFGASEGGTMVDLFMKLNHCKFAEAMRKLNANPGSFSFHGKQSSIASNIHVTKISPLVNNALLDYLTERKINIETARSQCREIHYTVNGKTYFAIGFANNTGGYEIRNKYFKGCISPKEITTIDNGFDTCAVFEGFMDYLSYLTLKNQQQPHINIVVLNSIILLQRAMELLKRNSIIHTFLDNDEAGKRTLAEIKIACKNVIDHSDYYKSHKDLNLFLCEKSNIKNAIIKSEFKMKR